MRRGVTVVLALVAAVACATPDAGSPWRERWHREGRVRWAGAGEGRLAVVDVGSGPAVILLHGLGGSAYDWREVIGPLAEAGHRVLAFDMLGSGESEKPTDVDYCPVGQARRIRWAASELGLERAAVVGNSYGGAVGACLAIEFPDFVERLVLISPAVVEQTPPWYVGMARLSLLGDLAYAVACKHCVVRSVLRRAWGPQGEPPLEVLREYVRQQRAPGQVAANLRMARHIDDEHAREALGRIGQMACPVLVLWGEQDAITPVAGARELARLLPRAEVRILDGEGHVPHMASPGRILPLLLDFLR